MNPLCLAVRQDRVCIGMVNSGRVCLLLDELVIAALLTKQNGLVVFDGVDVC